MKTKLKNLFIYFWEYVLSYIYNHKVLIFVGSSGSSIWVYTGPHLVDSIYIEGTEYSQAYETFLNKYPQHSATIILDGPEVHLHHASIPVAQSLLPANHIDKFISKTFQTDDIVASKVFEITTSDNGEVWHTNIVSTPETPLLKSLVSYVASNLSGLSGIYFFNLNASSIINSLERDHKKKINSNLRIFVAITSSSSIRMVVCDKDKVMESVTIPYPVDKSYVYIQGVIEQAVSDQVISLKNYIHHNEERPSLVMLVSKDMESLLTNGKFDVGEIIVFTHHEQFADKAISTLLNQHIENKASNEELKHFNRTILLNKLFFKPLWIILVVLAFVFGQIELQIKDNNRSVLELNDKYYRVSEEYRGQRALYPYINGFGSVIDFHDAVMELSAVQDLPFDFMTKFLDNLPDNFTIRKVDWQNINGQSKFKLTAKYTENSSDKELAFAMLEKSIVELQKLYKDYEIEYTKNTDQTLNQLGRVAIPIILTISRAEK